MFLNKDVNDEIRGKKNINIKPNLKKCMIYNTHKLVNKNKV